MELLELGFARARAARGLSTAEARAVLRLLVKADDEAAAAERRSAGRRQARAEGMAKAAPGALLRI